MLHVNFCHSTLSLSLSLSLSPSLPPSFSLPPSAYDYPGSLISSHTPRQRALSEAEDGTRVWHLFKQLDMEDPKRSPFMNKKLVSEIYLPRMLSTKVRIVSWVGMNKHQDDTYFCGYSKKVYSRINLCYCYQLI